MKNGGKMVDHGGLWLGKYGKIIYKWRNTMDI